MPELLPSDVARLVLGYLEETNCPDSYLTFLYESPYLEEFRKAYDCGKEIYKNFGLAGENTLLSILRDYCKLKTASYAAEREISSSAARPSSRQIKSLDSASMSLFKTPDKTCNNFSRYPVNQRNRCRRTVSVRQQQDQNSRNDISPSRTLSQASAAAVTTSGSVCSQTSQTNQHPSEETHAEQLGLYTSNQHVLSSPTSQKKNSSVQCSPDMISSKDSQSHSSIRNSPMETSQESENIVPSSSVSHRTLCIDQNDHQTFDGSVRQTSPVNNSASKTPETRNITTECQPHRSQGVQGAGCQVSELVEGQVQTVSSPLSSSQLSHPNIRATELSAVPNRGAESRTSVAPCTISRQSSDSDIPVVTLTSSSSSSSSSSDGPVICTMSEVEVSCSISAVANVSDSGSQSTVCRKDVTVSSVQYSATPENTCGPPPYSRAPATNSPRLILSYERSMVPSLTTPVKDWRSLKDDDFKSPKRKSIIPRRRLLSEASPLMKQVYLSPMSKRNTFFEQPVLTLSADDSNDPWNCFEDLITFPPLAEKIAENINKVKSTDGQTGSAKKKANEHSKEVQKCPQPQDIHVPDAMIKDVLARTESDPVFEQYINYLSGRWEASREGQEGSNNHDLLLSPFNPIKNTSQPAIGPPTIASSSSNSKATQPSNGAVPANVEVKGKEPDETDSGLRKSTRRAAEPTSRSSEVPREVPESSGLGHKSDAAVGDQTSANSEEFCSLLSGKQNAAIGPDVQVVEVDLAKDVMNESCTDSRDSSMHQQFQAADIDELMHSVDPSGSQLAEQCKAVVLASGVDAEGNVVQCESSLDVSHGGEETQIVYFVPSSSSDMQYIQGNGPAYIFLPPAQATDSIPQTAQLHYENGKSAVVTESQILGNSTLTILAEDGSSQLEYQEQKTMCVNTRTEQALMSPVQNASTSSDSQNMQFITLSPSQLQAISSIAPINLPNLPKILPKQPGQVTVNRPKPVPKPPKPPQKRKLAATSTKPRPKRARKYASKSKPIREKNIFVISAGGPIEYEPQPPPPPPPPMNRPAIITRSAASKIAAECERRAACKARAAAAAAAAAAAHPHPPPPAAESCRLHASVAVVPPAISPDKSPGGRSKSNERSDPLKSLISSARCLVGGGSKARQSHIRALDFGDILNPDVNEVVGDGNIQDHSGGASESLRSMPTICSASSAVTRSQSLKPVLSSNQETCIPDSEPTKRIQQTKSGSSSVTKSQSTKKRTPTRTPATSSAVEVIQSKSCPISSPVTKSPSPKKKTPVRTSAMAAVEAMQSTKSPVSSSLTKSQSSKKKTPTRSSATLAPEVVELTKSPPSSLTKTRSMTKTPVRVPATSVADSVCKEPCQTNPESSVVVECESSLQKLPSEVPPTSAGAVGESEVNSKTKTPIAPTSSESNSSVVSSTISLILQSVPNSLSSLMDKTNEVTPNSSCEMPQAGNLIPSSVSTSQTLSTTTATTNLAGSKSEGVCPMNSLSSAPVVCSALSVTTPNENPIFLLVAGAQSTKITPAETSAVVSVSVPPKNISEEPKIKTPNKCQMTEGAMLEDGDDVICINDPPDESPEKVTVSMQSAVAESATNPISSQPSEESVSKVPLVESSALTAKVSVDNGVEKTVAEIPVSSVSSEDKPSYSIPESSGSMFASVQHVLASKSGQSDQEQKQTSTSLSHSGQAPFQSCQSVVVETFDSNSSSSMTLSPSKMPLRKRIMLQNPVLQAPSSEQTKGRSLPLGKYTDDVMVIDAVPSPVSDRTTHSPSPLSFRKRDLVRKLSTTSESSDGSSCSGTDSDINTEERVEVAAPNTDHPVEKKVETVNAQDSSHSSSSGFQLSAEDAETSNVQTIQGHSRTRNCKTRSAEDSEIFNAQSSRWHSRTRNCKTRVNSKSYVFPSSEEEEASPHKSSDTSKPSTSTQSRKVKESTSLPAGVKLPAKWGKDQLCSYSSAVRSTAKDRDTHQSKPAGKKQENNRSKQKLQHDPKNGKKLCVQLPPPPLPPAPLPSEVFGGDSMSPNMKRSRRKSCFPKKVVPFMQQEPENHEVLKTSVRTYQRGSSGNADLKPAETESQSSKNSKPKSHQAYDESEFSELDQISAFLRRELWGPVSPDLDTDVGCEVVVNQSPPKKQPQSQSKPKPAPKKKPPDWAKECDGILKSMGVDSLLDMVHPDS